MDTLRQIMNKARKPIPEGDDYIIDRLRVRLDDFLGDPGNFIGSDLSRAALGQARKLWSRAKKAELVDDAIIRAVRRAESTGSGGNVQNAIKQNIRSILDSPKKRRGFTKEELQMMEEIVSTTRSEHLLRLIGKLSPSGNGLMLALGIGGTAFNPLMALLPAVGMASKSMADRGTRTAAQNLLAGVRRGSVRPPMLPKSSVGPRIGAAGAGGVAALSN